MASRSSIVRFTLANVKLVCAVIKNVDLKKLASVVDMDKVAEDAGLKDKKSALESLRQLKKKCQAAQDES